MVLHNPNNWHWVNKDVSAWTQDYLSSKLVGLKATAPSGEVEAEVSKVLSMDGDVDVSQRKGKVITIFDVKLQLEWKGFVTATEEGASEPVQKDVSGTITIPEVAHDTEENEYVFDIELYSASKEKEPAKDLVRSALVPQLRKALQQIGPALIAEHGKDIQHAPGTNPSSGFSTPRVLQSSSVNKSSSSSGASTTAAQGDGKAFNVTSLSDQQEFRTTADQLYQTFTDPARITAFTRGPPKKFAPAAANGGQASIGTEFEIFGGNVSGVYTALEPPRAIEQKWRLAQWPAGHFSTLKIRFEQNDVDSVTVMRVDWAGVPVGQEEPTKRNWDEYYVRSIKTTFGFGTIL